MEISAATRSQVKLISFRRKTPLKSANSGSVKRVGSKLLLPKKVSQSPYKPALPSVPQRHRRGSARRVKSIVSLRSEPRVKRRHTPSLVEVVCSKDVEELRNAVSTPKDDHAQPQQAFEELVKAEVERYLNLSDIDSFEYRSYSPIFASDIPQS